MQVLVAGAGIVGAAAAYHLADAGADVVLADSAQPGQATAAGAGVVFPGLLTEDPGWRQLAQPTLRHWADVLEPLGPGAGIGSTDLVYVDSVGGADVAELRTRLRALADHPGLHALSQVDWLDATELHARVPVLRDGLHAVVAPGGRQVDGRVLTERLLAEGTRRGVDLRAGQVALAGSGDQVVATVAGDDVAADAVVVAAGAWSTGLCAPLGVRLPVRPVRGQILHLDTACAETADWPVVRRVDHHYLLGFPGGRVVSGALHEPDAGFEHSRTVTGVAKLLDDVLWTAPGLAESAFAEVRVGFRPGSTDGLPVLGTLREFPGVVVATGLGAHGLTFGPYLGAVAADLALRREPGIDLCPYRPDRP